MYHAAGGACRPKARLPFGRDPDIILQFDVWRHTYRQGRSKAMRAPAGTRAVLVVSKRVLHSRSLRMRTMDHTVV